MKKSLPFTRIVASCRIALLVAVSSTMVGCATEVVTFSKSNRERGVQLYQDGEYGEAAGAFRHALRQNPRDYKSHFYLAQTYEKMGQQQQAIQSYKTAL